MEDREMILCDIGNTSLHFLDDEKGEFKESVLAFNPKTFQEKVYYISVNKALSKELKDLENWIDLEPFIERDGYYDTMGIDRIFALQTTQNGVIVDAGSAVTVDVVRDGVYEGGFIYPGKNAMQSCYSGISPALEYPFHFEFNQKKLAKNSQDAISYGYLKLLASEVSSYALPITLTGGDAEEFAKLFRKNLTIKKRVIFEGMQKVVKQL